MKRSRWALIIIGIIAIGGKLHFGTFCIGWGDKNNLNTKELKVTSYNVRLFDVYNPVKKEGIKNKESILRFLKNTNSDVYCFQEFYHQEGSRNFSTKEALEKELSTPFQHQRYKTSKYKGQKFGVALYSKHKIIRRGEITFSDVVRTYNYCIYADIVKAKDTFRIYNAHFQSIHFHRGDYALFNEENLQAAKQDSRPFRLVGKILNAYPIRAEQVKKVMEHVNNSPYPVIVMGDFNDTPMSYCYTQFNKVLTDAYRNTSIGMGRTYAGRVPAGRIDYIFHDESIGSKDFSIQKEKLSDHYAISCTLFKQ
ncbi:MAG: endonuclease/exonuclease/phosphatase family protein [Crocinitomicaceae bacterium]|nr:endonuclease/exonuclease/phosphatase family protein [Crocinitomicaceae bacterium]